MRRLFMLVAVATMAAAPEALQAQRGNASDIGGRPPRVPPGNAVGRNGAPLPGNAPRRVVFTNVAGVAPAAAPVSVPTVTMVPIVQQAGAGAAQRVADVSATSEGSIELVDALLTADGAPSAKQAERFVAQYAAMLTDPTSRRIAAASSAFNALVDEASPAYLRTPPAEFVAAQAVLRQLVEQTSRR